MNVRFESDINVHFLNSCMIHIGMLPLEMINPMVGDLIQIYHDTEFQLYMKVKSREWGMMNATPTFLIVTLTCTDEYTPDSFIDFLQKNNFPI